MQQILHAFKLRLTNLSQGNRSLKLGRLSARRDIDLWDLAHLAGKSAEELLEQVIAGKDITLITRIDPRHEPTNLADRRLNNIYRTVEMFLEESGTYDLYLGYPFVEGKFLDGTVVRSPLLLFPVRLERKLQGKPRWKLSCLDEPVSFNPTLFLAYENYQSWRFPAEFWEEEIEEQKDWQLWLQDLYAKTKQYELAVNFNSDLFTQKLEPFVDYRKDQMDLFKTGVLKFRSQAVLGIFPQSDSTLLQDYEVMEKAQEQFALGQYLGGDLQPVPEEKPIREEDRYFALPVDSAQEEALLMVKRGSSLVVHGPPGTGKSQVIVNLITDAMAHGKRILVVSQKRAALDVVFKRLDSLGLGRFAMLVHDHRHDRAVIYRKLQKQIEEIEAFQQEFRDLNKTVAEHSYRRLSRELDQQSKKLEELVAALQNRDRFGISPHELYLACSTENEWMVLADPAKKLTQDRLLTLLDKLVAVRDYREFFEEAYPWKHRLSFRHYQQVDRQRLLGQLSALPEQLTELAAQYQRLAQADLGKDLLDPTINTERITLFRRIDRYHKQIDIRFGVEALELDGYEQASVLKILQKWEKDFDRLENRVILTDDDWHKFDDLEKHLENWKQFEKKSFRFFRLPFLQARWYLYKILTNKGLEPNPELVVKIRKEFRSYQIIRSHYGKLHHRAFFTDFPLLETQAEKREWLDRKTTHLNIWKELNGITFFKQLRPVFDHGRWDDISWLDSMKKIEAFERFNQAFMGARSDWRLWLHSEQISKLETCIQQADLIQPLITGWRISFETDFADLKSLDSQLADFDPTEQSILELTEALLSGDASESEFRAVITNSVYLHWLEQLESDHPVLTEVSGRGWDRSLRDYQANYLKRQPEVASLVARRLKENVLEGLEFNRLNNRITYRDIHHQVKKKRRLWPVRKLITETWETGLQKLAPCWLASPESAAAMFPMQADLFDLVIFDEASQCFVERSLPIMLRGKQVIISGDDQQLPPSDLYRVRYEEDLDQIEDVIPLEVVSVLDLARQTIPERRLNWHYRSESEALIAFSNDRFYDGTLQMIPPASVSLLHQPPIIWEAVQGQWENNRNEAEAFRIVDLILRLAIREDRPSVGVVTFNFHQQELILDLIDQRLHQLSSTHPDQYTALVDLMDRVSGEEHQGLFVKNIENVQGDERDVIIFSIAYAKDGSGKLQTRFGLINQAGGENRLNVAITRARWQVIVVCSFRPDELQVENSKHDGPKVLKAYLQYAWNISQSQQQRERIEKEGADYTIGSWLKEKILGEGMAVVSGLGDTGYQLDLAVRKKGGGEFVAGIECEGPRYFKGLSAKERDLYRPQLLNRQHWAMIRVWARNMWKDPEKEWERVKKSLELLR